MHEVLPGLFAVGDDVNAGVLLPRIQSMWRRALAASGSSPCARHRGHSLLVSTARRVSAGCRRWRGKRAWVMMNRLVALVTVDAS